MLMMMSHLTVASVSEPAAAGRAAGAAAGAGGAAAAAAFPRLAVNGNSPKSPNLTDPVIVSPSTLPLMPNWRLVPWMSMFAVTATAPAEKVPVTGVEPIWLARSPDNLSPSSLSVRVLVFGPCGVSTVRSHAPAGDWANAPDARLTTKDRATRLALTHFMDCS